MVHKGQWNNDYNLMTFQEKTKKTPQESVMDFNRYGLLIGPMFN